MFILYWLYPAGITLINWSSNLEMPTLDIEIKHSRLTILNTKITAVKHFHRDLISYVTNIKRETPHLVAVVHLNFRAGSTFPVPVCTVQPGWSGQTLCFIKVEFNLTKGVDVRGVHLGSQFQFLTVESFHILEPLPLPQTLIL